MRCTQAVEAGSYVLGALPPAERSTYERHIAACATCRNEVAELAGLPGLLGRLDADTAASVGQPEEVAGSVLDTLLADARTEQLRQRRRRRWERGFTLLAAACVALVIGAGVSIMQVPAAPPPVLGAMSPAATDEPVTALIAYWPDAKGGTEIRMTCVYAGSPRWDPPDSMRLDLWVYPKGGGAGKSIWWWDAGPGYQDTFFAESDLQPDQIGHFEIREGATVLLSYQAA
jgi:anti-sigma-K factor RskA